jgi:hypothetical protein
MLPITITATTTIEDIWQQFESALTIGHAQIGVPAEEATAVVEIVRIAFYSGSGSTLALLNKFKNDRENFARVMTDIETRIAGMSMIATSMEQPR